MTDQKNTILAIVLSALVLIGWQIFLRHPADGEAEADPAAAGAGAAAAAARRPAQQPGSTPQTGAPPQAVPARHRRHRAAGSAPGQITTREARSRPRRACASRRRASPARSRSRARGIDDLALIKYRETVDPKSPPIVLLAPSGSPHPFYAEFGWVVAAGTTVKAPTADTVWRQEGSGALAVGQPVTLVYDNGEGLEFRRTIAVDDKYLFTVKDEVVNKGAAPVTLYPYALISRHGTPPTLGYYILHEGLIGVLGDKGLQEETYAKIEEKKSENLRRHQCLARHHRQILGGDAAPRHRSQGPARFSFELPDSIKTYPDRLPARPADDRARRHRHGQRAAVRRRQGSVEVDRRLRHTSSSSTASTC